MSGAAQKVLAANGLTGMAVAAAAGMTPAAVSHVLCGRTADVSRVLDAVHVLAGAAVARDVAREIELNRAIRLDLAAAKRARGES